MNRPEDEIQRKLEEIEAKIVEEPQPVSRVSGKTELKVDESGLSADLQLLVGLGLLLTGVFLVFNHVTVGTSFLALLGLGHQGFGLTIIPLLVGLGLIFYNHKMRAGWVITAASCALIFFAVLSQLVMSFPPTSLLGLVIMFLPLALGTALVLKGITTRRS